MLRCAPVALQPCVMCMRSKIRENAFKWGQCYCFSTVLTLPNFQSFTDHLGVKVEGSGGFDPPLGRRLARRAGGATIGAIGGNPAGVERAQWQV
mmetsp:Transcript_81925/g.136934  ORF Transcript_81925/g.136934 Transcript_81925/m.136934 type:complete len:94 (-) Transcript_81925:520-801(-)